MDIQKILKDAWGVATLKEVTMKKVVAEKDGLKNAFLVVAASSLALSLGSVIFPTIMMPGLVYRPGFMWVISTTVGFWLLFVIGYYFLGWVSTVLFKSKLPIDGFVRVMGYASIVGLVGLIRPISIVASIWLLVILWVALSKLGKLEPLSIIGVLAIPILLGILLSIFMIGAVVSPMFMF